MVGSSVFSLSSKVGGTASQILVGVMSLGTVSLVVAGLGQSLVTVSVGFLMFEAACGIYFPRYTRCARTPAVTSACILCTRVCATLLMMPS